MGIAAFWEQKDAKTSEVAGWRVERSSQWSATSEVWDC